jgi:phosphoenolpyruvate carboxylase
VLPGVYRDLERALNRYYPEVDMPVRPFLRFGSWMGADRDGNPAVTPVTTEATMELHRQTILDLYIDEIRLLRGKLSPSVRRVGPQAEKAAARDVTAHSKPGQLNPPPPPNDL